MKIGFIGGGNMAEAIIKGIVNSSQLTVDSELIVSEPKDERRQYLEESYGIETTLSNKKAVFSSDIIILAVKPQIMEDVLSEISGDVNDSKTVVSIAAGITLGYLTSKLKTKKLIRVMPNTPALVQEGMTVISLCECFNDQSIEAVREIFMSIGKVITLPEKHMNAVTALSGSGPAFIAMFVEALTEGAVKIGLNQDDALALAVQTAIGTSKLLDTGMSPIKLKEMVTSPGGTTSAGLKVFEEGNIRNTVAAAVEAAAKRAEELGKGEV